MALCGAFACCLCAYAAAAACVNAAPRRVACSAYLGRFCHLRRVACIWRCVVLLAPAGALTSRRAVR